MTQPVRHCVKCSGLNYRDGDDLVCRNCGCRVNADIDAVMQYQPVKANSVEFKWHAAQKVATYYIVVKFFDSIAAQRKSGASWYAIAKLLSQSGNRVQEKTLQKHFELEQGKRCDDGCKA